MRRTTAWCLAVLCIALASRAWALECHVDTSAENSVRFLSDAPIEDFEGVTDRIDGYVLWEGDGLAAGFAPRGSELYFEVPLAALRTGIRLRDRHMRENYLETDRFPYAAFTGVLGPVEGDDSAGYRVMAEGRLSIHGVERPYRIECRVTPAGKGYRVRTAFDVMLPDFDIEVPSLMFLKINERIAVELDFHLEVVQP